MGSVRKLLFWVVLAAAASALLGSVLWWERGHASARWSALPIGSPREGAVLFQKKGCVHCHAVKGLGGTLGPDLGSAGASRSPHDQLVVAMWNHAPRMWARMQAEPGSTPCRGTCISPLAISPGRVSKLEPGGARERGALPQKGSRTRGREGEGSWILQVRLAGTLQSGCQRSGDLLTFSRDALARRQVNHFRTLCEAGSSQFRRTTCPKIGRRQKTLRTTGARVRRENERIPNEVAETGAFPIP